MANKLHTEWLACKKSLEDQVARFKAGKSNQIPTPLQDALKAFNQGFGPKLDDVAKAYKAKNDAEVKKQAAKALVIAKSYDQLLDKKPTGENQMVLQGAKTKLQPIIHSLTELQTKGTQAADPF